MSRNEELQTGNIEEKKGCGAPENVEIYYIKELEKKIGSDPFTTEIISFYVSPNKTFDKNLVRVLTEQEWELLNWIKESSGDILLKAAKFQNEILLDLLMKCGVDVNYTDENYYSAADYAWKNKDYKILLLLLQHDSFFPRGFNRDVLSDDKEIEKLVDTRNILHKVIKKGDVNEVKDFILPENLKLYLNTNNDSAAYTAIVNKKFEVYAYLKSIGAEFAKAVEEIELNRLNLAEKVALHEAMIHYFPSVSNAHIFYLISKTRSQKPLENLKDVAMDYYTKLDQVPEISIILKTIQYADYLDIIFDFDEVDILQVNPTTAENTKGEARYKDGRLYIAAGLNRKKEDILGTLAHELTHMAMQILYNNDCNPYGEADEETVLFFRRLKYRIRNHMHKNLLDPSKTLFDALDNYCADDHDAELIVRIPHILLSYRNGRQWLEKNVLELMEFYKKNIQRKCEGFIEESVVLKPKSIIRSINESVGEILKLKSCDIRFKNFEAVSDLLKNDKNIFLYEVNNTFLGVLKVLQGTFGKEYINSCNNFLVLKFKNFMLQVSEIIEVFFSKVSNIMIIEIDDIPTDDELSETFDIISMLLQQKPNKKIVFVTRTAKLLLKKIKMSELLHCTKLFDDTFSLDDLDVESQKKILKKRITFQGRQTILRSLIQHERLYKFVTGEVLTALLQNGSGSIGNEILGLCHLEGPYADISMETDLESFARHLKNSDDIFLIRSKVKDDVVEYFNSNFEEEWTNLEIIPNKTTINDSEKVILVNDRFQSDDFKNFCRSNPLKKCHLIDFKDGYIILQKMYNPNFYVERKVKRIILKAEEVTKVSIEYNCDVFIIIKESDSKNVWAKYQNIKFLGAEEAKAVFPTLIEAGKNVHFLEIENEKFVWKDSYGSVREIRKCLDVDSTAVIEEENLILELIHKKIVLIADDPGMGKSTTLTKLYESRAISDTHWIIRINLKDHLKALRSHIKNINMEKVIRFLLDVEPSLKDDLNENLLATALTNEFSKCVLLAFDGFDEILDEDDRDRVISLLKFLKNETHSKVWVTTRLQYKEDLEIALETFAIEFEPFDEDMKKLFVEKYLKDRLNLILKEELFADGKIATFSDNLLLKMKEIFKVDVAKFIGTPLQLTLVMFGSLKYFRNWVENDSDLDFSYIGGNLREVYDNFIGKKYEVYFQKFNKIEKDTQRREKKISERYHKNLAESLVYRRENLKPEEEEKQLILSIGLIRNNFEFIHFTVREFYFAQVTADYLLGEIEGEKIIFLFKEIFAKKEFEMICNFLNEILKDNIPEENLQFLTKLFLENGKILPHFTTLDSVFAIVAKKGYENIFKLISSIYFLMVAASPSWIALNIFNRALFYNANLSPKHEIRKEMFCILKKMDLKKKWQKTYCKCLIVDTIFLAIRHKYLESMKPLLQEMKAIFSDFEMRQLFLELHDKHSHLVNVIIFLLESGGNLFSNNELTNFFMTNPSAFSTAACHNDAKSMKSLLSISEKIMKVEDERRLLTLKDKSSGTILHLAACNAEFEIIGLILEKVGKILTLKEQRKFLTVTDNQNQTALYHAVYKNRIDTVKLLIEYGEKVVAADKLLTIRNNQNQSVLNFAITYNRIEIAKFLTDKGKEILRPKIFRDWLTNECIFHSMLNREHLRLTDCENWMKLIKLVIVENEILLTGDLYRILARKHFIYGSIFHLAAYLGDLEFMKYILGKAEEQLRPSKFCEFLMMEKENGQTPLHLAVKNGIGIVKLLFETNERVLSIEDQRRLISVRDKSKELIVHKAAFTNDVEVLAYVLKTCEELLTREERRGFFMENSDFFHKLVSCHNIKIIDMMLEEIKKVLTDDESCTLLTKIDMAYGNFLHAAISNEDHKVLEKMLNIMNTQQQQETLTKTDLDGYNCLLLAIKLNKLEVTTLLFNKLKEIFSSKKQSEILQAMSIYNQTCLHLAVGKNRIKMMNCLFQKIEEILTPYQIKQLILQKNEPEGNTIVHEIASTNQSDLLNLLFEKMDFVLPIKTKQALIMTTDSNNVNVFHKVVQTAYINEKILKVIINQAEKVLTRNQQRELLMPAWKTNLFYSAIMLQKTETLKILLSEAKKILKPEDQIEIISKKVDHLTISKKKRTDLQYVLQEAVPSGSFGTLLHEAAYNGQFEIIGLLLDYIEETLPPKEKPKIITMKNSENETFLFTIFAASHINELEFLKSLFRRLKKILTPNDFRLLLMTSYNNSGSVFHVAAVNQKHEVLTILFHETEKLLSREELHDLFTAKADGFRSVLHAAIVNGEPEVVKLIINKGRQILTNKEQIETITAIDDNNRTFLHLIDENNLDERTRAFLHSIGKRSFHLRESHFVFSIITEWERLLTTKGQTKLLLTTDKYCRTALHMAVMNGKLEAVKLLLQHAEKVMTRADLRKFLLTIDFEGKTALEKVCYWNSDFLRLSCVAFIEENEVGSDLFTQKKMNFFNILWNKIK